MKKFLTSLLLLGSAVVYAQTPNTNHIKSTTYKVETADGINHNDGTTPLTEEDRVETIQYFDGLGRPVQSIQVRAGGNKENIVQHFEYDEYGRKVKSYLPYATSGQVVVNPLNLVIDPLSDLDNYYQNHYGSDFANGMINAYSETSFESSPLNRVMSQAAPGIDWAMGSGHEVKMDYQVNTTADAVRIFGVEFRSSKDPYEPTLVFEGEYGVGQLYKSIVKDENWEISNGNDHTVEEFTDKSGKVILKRTYDNNQIHDTQYVYDDYGNLTYVMSPEGSNSIVTYDQISTQGSVINVPWTDVVNVDREFADSYNEQLSEYDNDQILNIRLENAYNGQGGMTVTTYNNSQNVSVNFNLSVGDAVELLQGYVFDLEPYGDFGETDIGDIIGDGYTYSISIKDNHIFIDGSGDITQLNATVTNENGVIYEENFPWTNYMNVTNVVRDDYETALMQYNNDEILDVVIPNPHDGTGGLKVVVDQNDNIQLIFNSSHSGVIDIANTAIPLSIGRSLTNRGLGSVSGGGFNYDFVLDNNSIKISGSGEVSHLTINFSGANVIVEPNIDQPTLQGLCYIYEYDHRNRLIEKKIPGKDWEHIVYDRLDRPVLTQDGNQRDGLYASSPNWSFTKYDKIGRVVYTGLFNSTLSRKQLQQQLDTQPATNLYETRSSTGFADAGKNVRYTNNAFPTDNVNFEVLTISYYDDSTKSDGANEVYDTPVTVNADLQYSDQYTVALSSSNIGLPTISEVRVLNTDDWITSASYYDEKGRSIFGATINEHLGTSDKSWSQLDFVGKALETKTEHHKASLSQAINIVENLSYDHMDRLLTHDQKIDNQATERILSNTYDAMGQLVQKGVGGLPTASQSLQEVDYTYNVRGWLTGINNWASLGNDLFGFEISYNAPNRGAEALYNGNISETYWRTANDNIGRGYTYEYDALNRIKGAEFEGGLHQTSNMPENYSVNAIDYDQNGNILTLNRYGLYEDVQNNITAMDYVDKLTYEYAPKSNQLLNVVDVADNQTTGVFNGGYRDVLNIDHNNQPLGNDYIYGDMNGNMTKDNNKSIQSIKYNHLNLPTEIQFQDGKAIWYTYDASGIKLKKEIFLSFPNPVQPLADVTTYYAASYIYKEDGNGETLEFFSHPEGYVQKTGSQYEYVYQYKDHLGNIRLSYKDTDNNGSVNSSEIQQENNYYPFGLEHKGYGPANTSNYPYKFGGKELNEELGLDWYDITARNYDPALGRWMNIDPLAEQMRRHSPYNYAFDNPIYFIDPDGRAPSAGCPPDQDCEGNPSSENDTVDEVEESVEVVTEVVSDTTEDAFIASISTAYSLYQLLNKYNPIQKVSGPERSNSDAYHLYTDDREEKGDSSTKAVTTGNVESKNVTGLVQMQGFVGPKLNSKSNKGQGTNQGENFATFFMKGYDKANQMNDQLIGIPEVIINAGTTVDSRVNSDQTGSMSVQYLSGIGVSGQQIEYSTFKADSIKIVKESPGTTVTFIRN